MKLNSIRFIFLLFLVVVPLFFASAQDFPSEIWHKGVLVSIDGDTIRGQLKYYLQNNAVQVNTRNVMQTYRAR
jgi:hypothetical protein